ncbi:MAG: molybdopterin biosynthesis protein [Planctomycetaceae bacterium]|nr:molybdopterin biosynthesis protein [Planctomycetaceae bacterium]
MAQEQEQFLDVVDRDTAERLWWQAIRPMPLGAETVHLAAALGRVLAADLAAEVDVPSFDRSNMDGYALRADDTYGASEESPRRLRVGGEEIPTGAVPRLVVEPGTASPIATGGMLPRGADAVLMVEHARVDGECLEVLHAVAPGANLSFAGTDVAKGELVLRRGTLLSARETGLLAAIGRADVPVLRRPRVAIVSTGAELIAPGAPPRPAAVYDANATLLADAVRELGCQPVPLGIVGDDQSALDDALERGLATADVVLLSGGTSKGGGDLSYRVLARRSPGIVVHGVALKPGKPICLGAAGSTPVAILPGFPTSAIFTFHEFVAPVLLRMAGLGPETHGEIEARMAVRCNSERGRTEYLLVGLMPGAEGLAAYPMGKGSGSITTFSRADGFVIIPRLQEYVAAGERVRVRLLGRAIAPADLVVIGSHCIGLDLLLGLMAERGIRSRTLWVGSQGGLDAAARGECDLAGVHLLDPRSDTYNTPFLPPGVRLFPGYCRMQGLVHRPDDPWFAGRTPAEAVDRAVESASCVMVNRNRGSGTRCLLDGLLAGRRPPGFAVEVRSHNAVAAAVSQGRADWGVAIEPVARAYGLAFLPLRAERYDFAVPADRWDRPAVAAFRGLWDEAETRCRLAQIGLLTDGEEDRP